MAAADQLSTCWAELGVNAFCLQIFRKKLICASFCFLPAASITSDLSWIQTHKKKVDSKTSAFNKKPLRKFEPKRKRSTKKGVKPQDIGSPTKAVS